jgi:hypothetical protein
MYLPAVTNRSCALCPKRATKKTGNFFLDPSWFVADLLYPPQIRGREPGALKNNDRPDVHLIDYRGTSHHQNNLLLFYCVFERFSVRGVQTHHQNIFDFCWAFWGGGREIPPSEPQPLGPLPKKAGRKKRVLLCLLFIFISI